MTVEAIPNVQEDWQPTREGDSLARANYYIQQLDYPERGLASDGYHTFDQLYESRTTLYIKLCQLLAQQQWAPEIWISKAHSDGSQMDGWFLLGIDTDPGKQITFHLPEKYWNTCSSFATKLEKAPVFDGHKTEDVLKRIRLL